MDFKGRSFLKLLDFSPEEIEEATSAGCHSVTLGKRILRCETAPSAVLSMILYQYEM